MSDALTTRSLRSREYRGIKKASCTRSADTASLASADRDTTWGQRSSSRKDPATGSRDQGGIEMSDIIDAVLELAGDITFLTEDGLIDRKSVIDFLSGIENLDPKTKGSIVMYIESLPAVHPNHIADIGKKASISDNHENDCISRQAAIDIVRDKCKTIPTCAILAMDAIAKLPVALPEPKSPQNGSFDFEQPEIKSDRTTDDCISREAAIDALDEQIEQCNKALCSFDISPKDEYAIKVERASLEAYKEQLENMPSAQSEQRWIPVTERLTENDNEVLITVWDAEDDYVEVYKGFYQEHEWWTQWCHGCSKIKDEPCGENIVIAWMPLPEPYRGGEKE